MTVLNAQAAQGDDRDVTIAIMTGRGPQSTMNSFAQIPDVERAPQRFAGFAGMFRRGDAAPVGDGEGQGRFS